jgi:uncharacterized protein YciI
VSEQPAAGPTAAKLPVEHHLVTYSPGPGWVEGRSLFEQPLAGHARYQAELVERRKLLLSGPLLDREGGIAIIRAADLATASAMVAADPAVATGMFVADIAPLFIAFSTFPVGRRPPRRPKRPDKAPLGTTRE